MVRQILNEYVTNIKGEDFPMLKVWARLIKM